MYTKIIGLREKRRLPRLGKIRLGVKTKSAKTGNEYPTETPYFVCPPEVERVYGKQPTELDVLFPLEDTSITIPQAYEYYGSGKGLKCMGDGETALRMDDTKHDMVERECPCELLEEKKCSKRMHLRVILPSVNIGGIYQIDTSSFNSIIDINSSVDYIRALVGRIALVPLKLKRVKTETHHEGKKQYHYTLKLELEADINFINTLRENTSQILMNAKQCSLPAPLAENPALDEESVIITEEEASLLDKQRNEGLPPARPTVSTPQKKQETSGETKTDTTPPKVKEELKKELAEYCNGVIEYQAEILKEISFFEKEGKEYFMTDVDNPKISDKWAGAALGNLRKRIKKEKDTNSALEKETESEG